jgi:NADH-quinone oxidoreductase subunit L
VVAVVGVLTAFYAATIGMTQTDIKRVLAYSTISQLGYMFLGCGVAAFAAGIFHLMTHAFFKALLFLGAGSVIHALGGEQDLRRMGGLRKRIPWTFWTMTMATLAITGVPLFSGFFSKDEILWNAYGSPWGGHWLYWALGCVTAGMTSFYMFRLWFLTFFGGFRGGAGQHLEGGDAGASPERGAATGIHESPKVMTVPLAILAVLSVMGGYIGIPPLLGGANRFSHFLEPVFKAPAVVPQALERGSRHMEWLLMGGTTAAAALGFVLAWVLYSWRPELPARITAGAGMVYRLVFNKYYVDELYAAVLVRPLIAGSTRLLWRGIDANAIDRTLDGSARGAEEVSDNVRRMQSGNIRSYAGWITLGALAVLIYMIVEGLK